MHLIATITFHLYISKISLAYFGLIQCFLPYAQVNLKNEENHVAANLQPPKVARIVHEMPRYFLPVSFFFGLSDVSNYF